MNRLRSAARSLRHNGAVFLLAVLLIFTAPTWGQKTQKDPAVQRLYDHLSGTWTGSTHDYLTPTVVESQVELHVTQHEDSDWLDLEYLYSTPGHDKPIRAAQQDAFYLPAGILVRNFVSARSRAVGGLRMQLENFSGLVQDGFGDYTARSAIMWRGRHSTERIDYHLRADSWSYEIYVNTEGSTWEKTGDWELKRVSTTP